MLIKQKIIVFLHTQIKNALYVGKLPEWSIGTVSKTVVRVTVPRVRIPDFPQKKFQSAVNPQNRFAAVFL